MPAETKRSASARRGEGRRSRGDGGATRDQGGGSQPRPRNATREEQQWMEKHREKLSKTTLRARWTHNPDEHEDRPGQTLATRSHEVIRSWADARGAQPVTVGGRQDGRPRTLRFTFPQGEGGRGRLEPISWDDWFRSFDERELVFIYQEHRRDGRESNFWRLDNPRREEG